MVSEYSCNKTRIDTTFRRRRLQEGAVAFIGGCFPASLILCCFWFSTTGGCGVMEGLHIA
jgi:hypothetical protein